MWNQLSQSGIVRRGTKNGINWYVTRNVLGFPCAYIQLPSEGHRQFSDFEEVDAHLQLHGGCTYLGMHLPWEGPYATKAFQVIGWDYGHADDISIDIDTDNFQFQQFTSLVSDDEVVAEIDKVIDELLQHDAAFLSKQNYEQDKPQSGETSKEERAKARGASEEDLGRRSQV